MVSNLISLILILFTSGFVCADDQFSGNSLSETSSGRPSSKGCFSLDEINSEIREAISALKQGISYLKATEDEIVAELEAVVEKKLKVYDAQLKDELAKLKEEIMGVVHGADRIPRDCREVQGEGSLDSGVYRIRPENSSVVLSVWCEMGTFGGGWTRVLNRFDGSEDFYLNWTDYKNGFGKASGEHWLGLEHLHQLTNNKSNELLFELIDWNSKKVHALYDDFQVGNESEYYKIFRIGNYTGDAGDSFVGHVGQKFSTVDADHDQGDGNCAAEFEGGWWFGRCYNVHLTGRYLTNPSPGREYGSAIQWSSFDGFKSSLKEVRMMVRPRTGR